MSHGASLPLPAAFWNRFCMGKKKVAALKKMGRKCASTVKKNTDRKG
jgi:hypothetical protein